MFLNILLSSVLLGAYIFWNDKRLKAIPTSISHFRDKRQTPDDVRATAKRLMDAPSPEVVPEKTGRRYIVVGGGGFLGGWIVSKLLARGEEPHRIRLLDLSPPVNPTTADGLSKGIQFIKVDITDAAALEAAFKAPWPKVTSGSLPGITVFHTAANIRFYERQPQFLYRSEKVNVEGTKNVISAARAAGATVLVYTSSGSVGVRSTRLLLWPWEKEPDKFVQVVNDETLLPKTHGDFFSNYAVVKMRAERLVYAADKSPVGGSQGDVLRTGCIRPGNSIFGAHGDLVVGMYLTNKTNPQWISTVVQSFSYVENCAVAHLCYEARLIELLDPMTKNPDIGGQSFCITDPGSTIAYGDLHTTLETLTKGKTYFTAVSATLLFLLAHCIEWYTRAHYALGNSGWTSLAKMFPPVTGDIINLQPSMFYLTSIHLIFDDSRARLSPAKGGLGYTGGWTTLEGLHRSVEQFEASVEWRLKRKLNVEGNGTLGVGLGGVHAPEGNSGG